MSNGINSFSGPSAANIALGMSDFTVITSVNSPVTEDFWALVVDEACTYSATTEDGDDLPSKARAESSIRYGRFTVVDVTTSGRLLGYKRPTG
jgi:hypothetical protein